MGMNAMTADRLFEHRERILRAASGIHLLQRNHIRLPLLDQCNDGPDIELRVEIERAMHIPGHHPYRLAGHRRGRPIFLIAYCADTEASSQKATARTRNATFRGVGCCSILEAVAPSANTAASPGAMPRSVPTMNSAKPILSAPAAKLTRENGAIGIIRIKAIANTPLPRSF